MPAKFAVGDLVTWVNEYGVKFPERTVRGVEERPGDEPRYYLAPTDAPWCPVRESHLMLDADDPVVLTEGGHKIRYTDIEGEQWFLVGLTKMAFRTSDIAVQYARDNPIN